MLSRFRALRVGFARRARADNPAVFHNLIHHLPAELNWDRKTDTLASAAGIHNRRIVPDELASTLMSAPPELPGFTGASV